MHPPSFNRNSKPRNLDSFDGPFTDNDMSVAGNQGGVSLKCALLCLYQCSVLLSHHCCCCGTFLGGKTWPANNCLVSVPEGSVASEFLG